MPLSFDDSGSFEGKTNSTTPVTIVPAPSASPNRRHVRTIRIYNADTVSATVTVSVLSSGTSYRFAPIVLASGQDVEINEDNGVIVLDATTKSVQVVLAGAITTNQLEIVASWADYIQS